MPKMKTHQGGAKRLRVTAGGKLKRRRAGVSHFMEHKNVARKRAKHGVTDVSADDTNRAWRLLGKK